MPQPRRAEQDPALQAFFAQEADRAEETAGRIRAAILILVQARILIAMGDQMLAGHPKQWISTGVIASGLVATGWLTRSVLAAEDKERLLVTSTVLDALLAFFIVLPAVIWPREGYLGMLAAPDFGIWPIIATGAGLRLSAWAARLGPLAAMGALSTLLAFDFLLNPDLVKYGAVEVALAVVIMLGAMLLARGIEGRIRWLVLQGAQRAVEAERTRLRFGAYVSEELVDSILRSPDAAPGGGDEQQVAVLFSDIRGFTKYSEEIGPEALIAELNAYLEAMVGVIRQERGVVDKYIGDAILAVFGVPTGSGDEASRAVRAALAMHVALDTHNEERRAAGLPDLAHGVGVHFGTVVAGNVGSRERLQYTVIGDTVNVASRLQSATKELSVRTLFSQDLVDRAAAEGLSLPELQAFEPIELRGRKARIGVLTPAHEVDSAESAKDNPRAKEG